MSTVAKPASGVSALLLDHIDDYYTNRVTQWFLRHGYLKNRDGVETRFPALKLRVVQKRMFEYYDECMAARKPCLEIVCKPRKDGASTAAQAMNYHRLRHFPGRSGALLGDIQGTSDTVFEIFRLMALNDTFRWPDGRGSLRIDDKENNQVDDIKLPNGSTLKKCTAGSVNANRSGTIQVANATEVAYYPNNDTRDPLTGFIGSWSENGESSLGIMDSTSSGPAGKFYEFFMDERNGWKKIFVAWQEEADHVRPFAHVADEKKFLANMDKDSREVMDQLGLTAEQMHWRHEMMATKCGGSLEAFNREYPDSVESAFLQKTALRFNIGVLAKLERLAVMNKPMKGSLMPQSDKSVTFQPDDGGDVEIYEHPKIGCKYLGTWDPCTGRDQQAQGKTADPDYHSIIVMRAGYLDQFGQLQPPKVVAHHYSRLEVEVAADVAAAMSRYYGTCMFAVEVNGCGLYPVKRLVEIGIPVWERQRKNPGTAQVDVSAGWMTNEITRKTIVDNLGAKIVNWKPEDPTLDIPAMRIIGQLKKFVTKDGKPQAMTGEHDDDVMALAICLQNMPSATEMREFRRKPQALDRMLRREGWHILRGAGTT